MLHFILAWTLLDQKPINGEDAIGKVTSLARAFGVKGELRLQGLNLSKYGAIGDVWSVKLSGPRLDYESYVESSSGKVLFISGRQRAATLSFEKGVSLDSDAVSRRAQALLAATGEKRPIGKPYRQLNDGGEVMFWFPVLVNGYPFFGAAWANAFWFKGRSGTLIEYRAARQTPSVNASAPRISEKDARARLQKYLDDERKDAERKGYGTVVYSGVPALELGYYVPEKQPTGLLAWKAVVQSSLTNAMGSRGWKSVYLIDAISGEQIRYSVMPGP